MVLLDTSEFWHLTSLDVASDSSILVFGETQAPADIGMMRLSPQLQVLDSVRYVTAPSETCSNGIATLDNGFAIASIRVLSATDYDVHVVKADATGNIPVSYTHLFRSSGKVLPCTMGNSIWW